MRVASGQNRDATTVATAAATVSYRHTQAYCLLAFTTVIYMRKFLMALVPVKKCEDNQ
jgi:hypothetical protein